MIDPAPQEVSWSVPLDADTEHASYDTAQVSDYFAAATRAAMVLAAFRAPYRGRSTPVHAWWGSLDLAVSLFSGEPADPPSDDFIMRNAMDSQEVAVGWWPGDLRYPRAAFYAYAHPPTEGFPGKAVAPPAARWDGALGEYVLDWDDVRDGGGPARDGAGVRPVGVPARVRGVRMGSGPRLQRRFDPAAHRLTCAVAPARATKMSYRPPRVEGSGTPGKGGCP